MSLYSNRHQYRNIQNMANHSFTDKEKVTRSFYIAADVMEKVGKLAKRKQRSNSFIVEKLLRDALQCAEDEKEIACS